MAKQMGRPRVYSGYLSEGPLDDVSHLRTASPQRLMEEMAKCRISCANCHRKESSKKS